MATLLSSLPASEAGGVGVVLVGEEPEPDDREPVDIIAAIFFDGTGNNRTNTTLRLEEAKGGYVTVNNKQVKIEGSFESYYSNVAVMGYMSRIENNLEEVSIYVEGIGTTDGGDDDTMGMAFGMGATGVPTKVTRGILLLTDTITRLLQPTDGGGPGKRLNRLRVDAVGFSRGATAARHFVARRTNEWFKQYTSLSGSLYVEEAVIEINFVGLYDTVSSYGGEEYTSIAGQIYHNRVHDSFDDDVRELHLALGDKAKEVVQLAAADEYRKNFASTTIASSVKANKGLEVRLPGVHSDIGGSYQEYELEERNVTAADARSYIQQQWYTAEQLTPINVFKQWYRGSRPLTHHYQFIALTIMLNQAKAGARHEPMKFEEFAGEFQKYAVPEDLRPLYELMNTFVEGRPAPSFGEPKPGLPANHNDDYSQYKPAEFALTPEWYWVRNRYLHRSARKGEWTSIAGYTMTGRTTNNLPDRQIIQDLTP